jgi:transposase InsO family protein
MKDQGKADAGDTETRRTEIALFRYGLLTAILQRELDRGEIAAHLRQVAKGRHQIPGSSHTTVSFPTLWRWLLAYRKQGFDGLKPHPRRDGGIPRCVPQGLIERAILLRQEVPGRSAATIVQILARDPVLPPVKESTLRHLLAARGYGRGQAGVARVAVKRFEWRQVNALWQGDALVGPWLPDPARPGKVRRAHLFAFIDDHSRLVPYAEWFWEEALPRMERVLKLAVLRRGLPRALYVDNGLVYASTQFGAALATLGIRRIHSRPYCPRGRGKIERWFGEVRRGFLPEVEVSHVSTLEELNASFWAWLEVIYHRRLHSETGQSPLERYQKGLAEVKTADPIVLQKSFLWRERRKVSRSATISLQGNSYAVDPQLIGRDIELRFDPFQLDQLEVWLDGKSLGPARVLKLEHGRHLALAGLTPQPVTRPQQARLDFLAALRAEYEQLLREEMGHIPFARALPDNTKPRED